MSRRLDFINLLARHLVRPHLAHARDFIAARQEFERAAGLLPPPPGVTLRHQGSGDLWVPPDAPDTPVILYLHGGAYIAGSPTTHRRLAAQLARATGLRVAVPDYRLAPEHPAPAAFDDSLAAYRALAAQGDVILGGDSAGGGLAMAVLSALGQDDRRPLGVFVFSPWVDLTGSGASLSENAEADRLLDFQRFAEVVDILRGALPPDDPRLSPVFAQFRDPPPVLIQVAGTEGLRDDAHRLADRLRAAHGEVVLSELPDAPHVWQMLDFILPEARDSLDEVARFVARLSR